MKVTVSQVLRIRVEGRREEQYTALMLLEANGLFPAKIHGCAEDKASFFMDAEQVQNAICIPVGEPVRFQGLSLEDLIKKAANKARERGSRYSPAKKAKLLRAAMKRIAEGRPMPMKRAGRKPEPGEE